MKNGAMGAVFDGIKPGQCDSRDSSDLLSASAPSVQTQPDSR
jgi:hypothetical protein